MKQVVKALVAQSLFDTGGCHAEFLPMPFPTSQSGGPCDYSGIAGIPPRGVKDRLGIGHRIELRSLPAEHGSNGLSRDRECGSAFERF